MEVTFYHKNLTKREVGVFNKYVAEKADAIAGLLTKFASDAINFNASMEKFEKHDAYQVEFRLKLPTKTLISNEASHNILKAVDESKDRLMAQIKKHMALLRKERSHGSIRKSEVVAKPAYLQSL